VTTPATHPTDLSAPVTIRAATEDDLDDLVAMINAAYLKGEGHVFHGTTRTGRTDLASVDGLWVAETDRRVVACVQIDTSGEQAHFGLLATSLEHQGRGLASMLIQYAERTAIDAGYTVMRIEVVREGGRIPWYERRGYGITGETDGQTWNGGRDWGAPAPWHMTDMEKRLR
jgi:GNAT superfamily N-acetyltransferase